MDLWLSMWQGCSARHLQLGKGLEMTTTPIREPLWYDSTYMWTRPLDPSTTANSCGEDLLLLHSHVVGTRCLDHFSLHSSLERDRALRTTFDTLLEAGRLSLDASVNEQWFKHHEKTLLPDPKLETEWGMPALLATLAPPRDLPETPDPPGLGMPLFPYQRQALTWMLRQESPPTLGASVLSPLWRAVRAAGAFVADTTANRVPPKSSSRGELLYQNILTGQLLHSSAKPLAPAHTLLRGGILADAPGLGKTAELAALILAHPFDPTVADTSANGNTMRERGVEDKVTRVKTTLVVVTDSILEQWIGELRRFTPGLTVAAFPDDVPDLQRLGGSRAGCSSKDVAAAVTAVEGLDVLVITYGRLRNLTHGPVCEALRNCISWWRVVLDEAQTCFNATSAAALAVSHLWKANVWCTTGTPIGHTLDDLHGLFEILDSDPWASQRALTSLMVEPYEEREPGSYGRMHALLRSVMLRREADHPDVVAATHLARPVWITPALRLSPPEAARYQAAYQAVFRRADRELEQLHAKELNAERQLRDGAVGGTQAQAVADAKKDLADQTKKAADMQAQAYLAAAASAASAAAGVTQESLRKGKGKARAASDADTKAAKGAADAALASYLTIPVRTRLYNSTNAEGEPLVADREEDEEPSGQQVAVMGALCQEARLALEDAALALWNAEQGAATVAQCIRAAEESLQPDRWVTALSEAIEYLSRLHGEDDGEDDDEEGDDAERAASVRRRQLRRARKALLTGRGGAADGVRGTAGLAAAVTSLRRMINHPSLEGPNMAGLPNAAAEGTTKASFYSMLEAANAAVMELEAKHSSASAAWKAAGGAPGGRKASEVTYIAQRLNAARKRLELLQLAVRGQEDSVCCICLEPPGEGDPHRGVLALPCLHPACASCLAAWLKEGQGCPLCRAKVTSTVTLHAASQAVSSSAAASSKEAAAAAAKAVVSSDVLRHGSKLAWLLHDVAHRLRDTAPADGPFKCVVFSAWEAVLATVSEALKGAGITVAEGYSPPHLTPALGAAHCQAEINRFKASRSGSVPVTVLLLPLRGAVKSAAAGLNLQEASGAYLFDPSTSRALEEQAVARVCRIGQQKAVTIVRMCAQRTLDEDVVALQAKLGAGRGGAAADEFVSGEDLAMLFGISAMHQQQAGAEPAAAPLNDGAGPSTAIVLD
jgi:hypothetical protein